MRGKPIIYDVQELDEGITPADAGKTFTHCLCPPVKKDHPRGCGENLGRTRSRKATTGSPPRMRGKLVTPYGKRNFNRITPAGAGKTVCS